MKLDISKLSQAQITNLNSALDAYRGNKVISSMSPPVLYLELTQNCISRCIFCKRKWNNNLSSNMPEEIFNKLLNDYIPYSVLVDLRGWGESLMLPNFDEYVSKTAAFSPKMRLSTTLGCGRREVLQSLVDNDVYLSVSFDAANRNLYEKIRRGISYETVVKNIAFVTAEMRKRGTLEDNIRLAVAPLQKANLSELERIIDFADYYGITEIALDPLEAWPMNFGLLQYHRAETIRMLKRCIEYSRKKGIRLQLISCPFKELYIKDHSFDICCHPWLYIFVDYKGDVFFCDHLLGPSFAAYAIGNIFKNREELWNGPAALAWRDAHIQRHIRGMPKKCKACYTKGRYADHEHEIDSRFKKWLVTENELEEKIKK